MAQLYCTESIPLPVVVELRALGHDVLTARDGEPSHRTASDDTVLSSAAVQLRIVVTFSRKEFARLHRANPNHAGIIACMVDPDAIGLAGRIDSALRYQPDMTGQLVRINRAGM